MVDIREITLSWQVPRSAPGTTVLYFFADDPVTPQRAALGETFFSLRSRFAVGTTMEIATEGRVLDSDTGGLIGTWADPGAAGMAGTGAGDQVPNSSMGLMRYDTGNVVDGRRLKGRSFLPGLDATILADGEIPGAIAAEFASFFTLNFTGAGVRLLVWGRPRAADPETGVTARAGATGAVETFTMWTELAVLRRRR